MKNPAQDVLITGIGLVSSLGEGIDLHLDLLGGGGNPRPVVESERFAPYFVHPLCALDWSAQIPKKGDQRQMEPWQKIGTYAAGLALENAGLPADEATRSGIDMIVAAGGGERDIAVDTMIMERARGRAEPQALVNQLLSTELRPTLFLAQLSNLSAGNISIVHKVTGSSRTFMGEEGAGISAIATAASRVAAGQSNLCLVGGAFSAERKDLLLNYELGGYLLKDEWRPVFSRTAGHDGLAMGSVGAFLVLESADHARARGARAYARLGRVAADRGPRDEASLRARLDELFEALGSEGRDLLVMSGASGVAEPTEVETSALRKSFPGAALRAYGSMLGHSFEAHFPAGIALAAATLARQGSLAPFEAAEGGFEAPPAIAVVTTVGHRQAEGACVLHSIESSSDRQRQG